MTSRESILEGRRQAERAKYDDEYFREHYWAEDLEGRTGNRSLSYEDPDHLKRFTFLARTLAAEFEFQSLLDAGCGTGLLMLQLSALGKTATGIDFSDAAKRVYDSMSAGKLDAPAFAVGLLHDLPFPDSAFDLTWCSDVMEHIPLFDVEQTIAELTRVTKVHLALTINLDNPYEYHPTVLSRDTWRALFEATGELVEQDSQRQRVQTIINQKHPEYELFLYKRIRA